MEPIRSMLQETDWNDEWMRLQAQRGRLEDAAAWDRRASAFQAHTPGTYLADFMRLADVQPGESVLDAGCGIGRLAVAYAQRGHRVLATDFSPAMLEMTRLNAEEAGVLSESGAAATSEAPADSPANPGVISTKLLSWQDDWGQAGLAAGSVDVALASRSIATSDMRDALRKLTTVARRRCCITLTTTFSPRVDARMLRECRIPNHHGRDFQYALNILINDGFLPTCAYITSERKDTFADFEDARNVMGRMVASSMGGEDEPDIAAARRRLDAWLGENLVPNETAGAPDADGMPELALRLRHNRLFTWAFIAWDASR